MPTSDSRDKWKLVFAGWDLPAECRTVKEILFELGSRITGVPGLFVSSHAKRMARAALEAYSGLDQPAFLGSGVALVDISHIRGVKKFLSAFVVPPKPLPLWGGGSDPLRLIWVLMAQEGEPRLVVRDFAIYMDRLLQDLGLLELFQKAPAAEVVGQLEKILHHDLASKNALEAGDHAKALRELTAALEIAPRSHLFSTRKAQLLSRAVQGTAKGAYASQKKRPKN